MPGANRRASAGAVRPTEVTNPVRARDSRGHEFVPAGSWSHAAASAIMTTGKGNTTCSRCCHHSRPLRPTSTCAISNRSCVMDAPRARLTCTRPRSGSITIVSRWASKSSRSPLFGKTCDRRLEMRQHEIVQRPPGVRLSSADFLLAGGVDLLIRPARPGSNDRRNPRAGTAPPHRAIAGRKCPRNRQRGSQCRPIGPNAIGRSPHPAHDRSLDLLRVRQRRRRVPILRPNVGESLGRSGSRSTRHARPDPRAARPCRRTRDRK